MEKTKGFVLKTIKYGDTSAILKVYTQNFGIKSFLQKGYFNPKKKSLRSLQFPFAQAEFSFRFNKKSDLILPSQVLPLHTYTQLFQHPVKMLMLQFLSEIAAMVLKEEEANPILFNFIDEQLQKFNDKKSQFADFHILFMMQITQHLGFFPNITNLTLPYFDMQEGNFIHNKNATFLLNEAETILWKKLILSEFSLDSNNQFNQKDRNELTFMLINYYKLHLPNFREPHALEIIKEVFNA